MMPQALVEPGGKAVSRGALLGGMLHEHVSFGLANYGEAEASPEALSRVDLEHPKTDWQV